MAQDIQPNTPDCWFLIIVTCDAYWCTVTRTGIIRSGLMWYLLMSPGSTQGPLCFLDATIHLPLNGTTKHSATTLTFLWADSGLTSKYQMRPVRMVPVWCLCYNTLRRWRCSEVILGHLSECLERYPAASKRLWIMQTEKQRPIRMISPTLIPDTEGNMWTKRQYKCVTCVSTSNPVQYS